MPGMSGLDLQETLLAPNTYPPIISIASFPADRIRRQRAEAAAAGFFSKRIDSQTFSRSVPIHDQRRRSAQRTVAVGTRAIPGDCAGVMKPHVPIPMHFGAATAQVSERCHGVFRTVPL
jgi:hypothetical protein